MKIRDELIVRIVELDMIYNNIIKNYDIMALSILSMRNVNLFFIKNISVDKKIMSGKPVLKNTRFPISQIIEEISDGNMISDICSDYSLDFSTVIDMLKSMALYFERNIENKIVALPASIMRNFRGLADEYKRYWIKLSIREAIFPEEHGMDESHRYTPNILNLHKIFPGSYTFSHKSKTDYKLTDGFVEWLHKEYNEIKNAPK